MLLDDWLLPLLDFMHDRPSWCRPSDIWERMSTWIGRAKQSGWKSSSGFVMTTTYNPYFWMPIFVNKATMIWCTRLRKEEKNGQGFEAIQHGDSRAALVLAKGAFSNSSDAPSVCVSLELMPKVLQIDCDEVSVPDGRWGVKALMLRVKSCVVGGWRYFDAMYSMRRGNSLNQELIIPATVRPESLEMLSPPCSQGQARLSQKICDHRGKLRQTKKRKGGDEMEPM